MTKIAANLSERGFILRSGGADGADSFFEAGAKLKHIYLPWKGFNGNESSLYLDNLEKVKEATEIAKKMHPAWDCLKQGGQKLHIRNIYQVLGGKLDNPSSFLICWTKGGEEKGGTATAMKLAREKGVRVLNLWHESVRAEIVKKLEL